MEKELKDTLPLLTFSWILPPMIATANLKKVRKQGVGLGLLGWTVDLMQNEVVLGKGLFFVRGKGGS